MVDVSDELYEAIDGLGFINRGAVLDDGLHREEHLLSGIYITPKPQNPAEMKSKSIIIIASELYYKMASAKMVDVPPNLK